MTTKLTITNTTTRQSPIETETQSQRDESARVPVETETQSQRIHRDRGGYGGDGSGVQYRYPLQMCWTKISTPNLASLSPLTPRTSLSTYLVLLSLRSDPTASQSNLGLVFPCTLYQSFIQVAGVLQNLWVSCHCLPSVPQWSQLNVCP